MQRAQRDCHSSLTRYLILDFKLRPKLFCEVAQLWSLADNRAVQFNIRLPRRCGAGSPHSANCFASSINIETTYFL